MTAKYVCACGVEYESSVPYKFLYCLECGSGIPRQEETKDDTTIDQVILDVFKNL